MLKQKRMQTVSSARWKPGSSLIYGRAQVRAKGGWRNQVSAKYRNGVLSLWRRGQQRRNSGANLADVLPWSDTNVLQCLTQRLLCTNATMNI